MNMMANISTASRSDFRINVPGGNKDGLNFCTGSCNNVPSLETAVNDGDGKVMYDTVARTFGFDPKTVRQNPEAHDKVMGRLSRTIKAMIADHKANRGIASAHNSFRTAAAQIARAENELATAGLNNLQSAKSAANMPGASLLSNGQVRTFVQTSVNAQKTPLGPLPPHLKVAAVIGNGLGTVGTIAASQLTVPDIKPEVTPKPDSTEKPTAKEQVKTATLGLDVAEERKRDDSCAPKNGKGEWVVVNRGGVKDRDLDYQSQVTLIPRLPGKLMVEYEVTSATGQKTVLDGCAIWSPRKEGLDAKNGYDGLLKASIQSGLASFDVPGKLEDEARKQADVMEEHPVDWHHSSDKPETVAVFQGAVGRANSEGGNMSLVRTPEQPR
jgi:hypothetical protein